MSLRPSSWRLPALAVALVVVWLVRQTIWIPVLIVGESMQPTLRSGRLAGVNRLAYRRHAPRRGDIVAVWTGRDLMIKRVVGLPGEDIGACDGIFQVNGVPLAEPYVGLRHWWSIAPGRLDAESYVVAGDNRSETLVAVVHRSRIVGRLVSPLR